MFLAWSDDQVHRGLGAVLGGDRPTEWVHGAHALRHLLALVLVGTSRPMASVKFVYGIPAGQIALHADAERRALDGDRLGELVHRALGRAVDAAAPRHEAGDRSGVEDHAAVTLLLELHDGVLAAEEHALGR